MTVYIDKQNLVSYVHSKGDVRFEDCNTMLKKCCDIKFTFSKDAVEKLDDIIDKEASTKIKLWMATMVEGFKGRIMWGVDFPPRPLKTNMCNDFPQEDLSAIYLLDDEKCARVKETGRLLIAEPGNELDALEHLIIGDDNLYTRILNPKDLENWDGIEQYLSPCTDIIIADPYLMSDHDLYDNNLYALVVKLASKSKCKLNYIFITNKCILTRERIEISPDWETIKSTIKDKVEQITGYCPNVTFVLKQNIEHDRTIFTNYKQYISGDTFNYFDSCWKVVTRGRYLNIHSIASKDCWDSCCSFLDDMQAVNIQLEELNPDQIIGDKKGLYLKFTKPVQL